MSIEPHSIFVINREEYLRLNTTLDICVRFVKKRLHKNNIVLHSVCMIGRRSQ